MRSAPDADENELNRQQLSTMAGTVVVEFGASWCGICRAFAPEMKRLLAKHPDVTHLQIEDGRGKPLGRSFRVTLWPTFVLLRDGQVIRQLVRPETEEMRAALEELVTSITPNPTL